MYIHTCSTCTYREHPIFTWLGFEVKMENWQNRHVRIQGDDPIVTFVSPSYFLGEKIRLRCEWPNRINFFPPKPWYLYVTHTFQFFGPKNRKHDVKTERGIYLWKCPGRYFRNFILFSKIIWMMDRAAVVSLFCLRNGPPGFSTNSYVRKSDALYIHVHIGISTETVHFCYLRFQWKKIAGKLTRLAGNAMPVLLVCELHVM